MAPPRAGPRIIDQRYELLDHLGNGNFGEVWRSHDLLQDDEVALKLVGPHVTLDEVLLEGQLLTRLRQHDRVVTIRNVALAPLPYIVMDYLAAGSVEAVMNQGAVPLDLAVRWIRNGLAGLGHAHAMGVLHRDVKPGNLLLDDEGRAVLSDFGIAEDTIRNLLANPNIYGLHAAPELLNGQPSSVQTDIFAMGCTLYRLATGEYPFASIADIQAGQPAIDAHRVNPQIPLSLTRVLRTALASDPAARFADARSMREALGDCGIRSSWEAVAAPDVIERWDTEMAGGRLELTVRERPRAGDFEVILRRDLGAGLRRVSREECQSRARALQVRRGILVRVVEGRDFG